MVVPSILLHIHDHWMHHTVEYSCKKFGLKVGGKNLLQVMVVNSNFLEKFLAVFHVLQICFVYAGEDPKNEHIKHKDLGGRQLGSPEDDILSKKFVGRKWVGIY